MLPELASLWFLLAFLLAILAVPALLRQRRRARRLRVRARPFPAEWREILAEEVPLYRLLPGRLKDQLHGHIQVFLAEKNLEGAGGLEMTDGIRLSIAARACLLLLDRETGYYPRLYSIIVYPGAFTVEQDTVFSDHAYLEGTEVRSGESWSSGAVILAWDEARWAAGARDAGYDVVLHEFAHQLDEENSHSDGIPILADTSQYARWAKVLGREFRKLQRRARSGQPSLLDDYGAKNAAEFFAVATECFFAEPGQLKEQIPDLYEELKGYYNQDPVTYYEPEAST